MVVARRRRFHVNPFDFSSSRVLDSCLDFLLYSSSDYMLLVISSFPRRSFPSRPTAIHSKQPAKHREKHTIIIVVPSRPISVHLCPVPPPPIHPSSQPARISFMLLFHVHISTIHCPQSLNHIPVERSSFAWHGMLGSS